MLINVWFLFTDRTDKPMQLLSKAGDNYDYTTINRGKLKIILDSNFTLQCQYNN